MYRFASVLRALLAGGTARLDRSLFWGLVLSGAGCSVLIDTDPAKLGAGSGGGHCDPACDDGIPCTIDECGSDNKCHFRPSAEACDDGVSCTEDICDPKKGCTSKPSDERCEFCAPGSRCDVKLGGCVGFSSQRNCNDSDPCTKDACDVAAMMCVADDVDEDGDGYAAAKVGGMDCGGKDCDDTRASVYPGAPETCNGRDDDCNGKVDDNCMAGGPDTCESVVDVNLNGQGNAMIEGSFAALEANYDVSCGSEGAPDAVYRLVIEPDPADIVIEAVGDSAELVLAAGLNCGDAGFRLACAEPLRSGGTRLAFHRYSANELFILIDAKSKSESGDYRVRVSVKRAAADNCLPTAFDHSGCGTLVGVMPMQPGELLGSCQPGGLLVRGAAEAVFRINGNTEKLTFQASGEGFTPALYTRDGCGAFSSELSCDMRQNGQPTVSVDPRNAETYLVLDGAQPGQEYKLTCR